MKRHVVLPARGVLIVNTDVHGNARDFERVEAIFRAERTMEPETHWVILLGNHDHGHCGGPHTHTFYPDEVTALESTLSEAQRARLHRLCESALLAVAAPHDRDEKGFFHEGSHQVCPVIFGAAHPNKRYLRLDLGAKYEIAAEVREEFEILRLHEPVIELT